MALFRKKKAERSSATPTSGQTRTPDPQPPPSPSRPSLHGASWNLVPDDLVYISHVRDTGDTGAGDASDLDDLLANDTMARQHGESFQFTIRCGGGREVELPGFSHRSVSVSSDLSAWASGGFLSHTAMGLPGALDTSAIDGRNNLWNSQTLLLSPHSQLLTGGTDGHLNPTSHFGSSVIDVAHLPTEEASVVTLEYVGGEDRAAVLAVTSMDGAERRVFGTISRTSGAERLYPHPAGRWILVTGNPCRLVDLEDSTYAPIDGGLSFGWWPQAGDSALIGSSVRDGRPLLVQLDLATGTVDDIGPVEGGPSDLDPHRWMPREFTVAPSGALACLSGLGPPSDYQEQHGTRERVHNLDLDSRTLEPLHGPFVGDSDRLERVHRSPRYVGRIEAGPLMVAEPLVDSAIPLAAYDLSVASESIWMDANDLAVKALASLHEDGRAATNISAMAALVPSALWALRRLNPDVFSQMADWATRAAGMAMAFGQGGPDEKASAKRLWDGVRPATEGFAP